MTGMWIAAVDGWYRSIANYGAQDSRARLRRPDSPGRGRGLPKASALAPDRLGKYPPTQRATEVIAYHHGLRRLHRRPLEGRDGGEGDDGVGRFPDHGERRRRRGQQGTEGPVSAAVQARSKAVGRRCEVMTAEPARRAIRFCTLHGGHEGATDEPPIHVGTLRLDEPTERDERFSRVLRGEGSGNCYFVHCRERGQFSEAEEAAK